MAQTIQEPKLERIEIVDQPEDITGEAQKKSWLRIPLALVAIAAIFFLVRRFISKKEEF